MAGFVQEVTPEKPADDGCASAAGGALALTLCLCLAAGCSDRRVRARIDESGPPVRGGTLELVGSSDVDHLATTSAYVISSLSLVETFARQLLAYSSGP